MINTILPIAVVFLYCSMAGLLLCLFLLLLEPLIGHHNWYTSIWNGFFKILKKLKS